MNTVSTTQPQALLIKNWQIYFENGQTRRIKNLTYSLSPVDYSSMTRKALLRKGAAGYQALAVFSELIDMATRCPQRGLLVESTGAITPEQIAARTGMPLEDVVQSLELLARKEVAWIVYVTCPKRLIVSGSLRKGRKGKPLQPELVHLDNPHPESPDLHIEWEYAIVDKGNGPETERRLPKPLKRLLDAEKEGDTESKDVACHTKKSCSNTPKSKEMPAACHTEPVDIKGVSLKSKQKPGTHIPRKTSHHRPFYQTVHSKR